MNSITKIKVKISFPLGALFYSNLVDYTYKSFLKMVKQLSCVNIEGKCFECPLKAQCQYYKVTGQNFSGYPGIIFKRSLFEKNIFKDNETYQFDIYLIGNNNHFKGYVEVFFKDYTNFSLANHPYQLRHYEEESLEQQSVNVNQLSVTSIIDSDSFKQSYNQMVSYYNEYYGCNYKMINESSESNSRTVNYPTVHLPTKRIRLKGFIYDVSINTTLSSDLIEIGIGQYNYLGGGHIAIKNRIKDKPVKTANSL